MASYNDRNAYAANYGEFAHHAYVDEVRRQNRRAYRDAQKAQHKQDAARKAQEQSKKYKKRGKMFYGRI